MNKSLDIVIETRIIQKILITFTYIVYVFVFLLFLKINRTWRKAVRWKIFFIHIWKSSCQNGWESRKIWNGNRKCADNRKTWKTIRCFQKENIISLRMENIRINEVKNAFLLVKNLPRREYFICACMTVWGWGFICLL